MEYYSNKKIDSFSGSATERQEVKIVMSKRKQFVSLHREIRTLAQTFPMSMTEKLEQFSSQTISQLNHLETIQNTTMPGDVDKVVSACQTILESFQSIQMLHGFLDVKLTMSSQSFSETGISLLSDGEAQHFANIFGAIEAYNLKLGHFLQK